MILRNFYSVRLLYWIIRLKVLNTDLLECFYKCDVKDAACLLCWQTQMKENIFFYL